MTFLNTSLIRKLTLFLAPVMLSVSAMAADFNQVQRSAIQGDSTAQFNLGVMYYQGLTVPQDYTKARQWYEKAANQGDADAQFNLGLMYQDSKGVPQNMTIAKEWFGKACDNGDQNGCDAYRNLNQ